jgi:diguanylate cyclase (GGDEF)-like protein
MLALLYLFASALYLSFVSRNRNTYLWRRHVAIFMDLGVATYLTTYFGTAGVAFYPLFLWVMIGNGLRYGRHFMQVATLIGLLGFTGAMATSGFLWAQPGSYLGLMFGLVLMPRFFMVMITRLSEVNVQLQAQRDEAEFMATHDALTGLPNRAYLYTRLEQALASAERHDTRVAVAFIDIDNFKSINDTFGHEFGDDLLSQVADAMRGVLRSSDTVARLGGDEFVVVIEDDGESSRIGRVVERLFSCVGRYYEIGGYETYVTWSCGVVVYPEDGRDTHTLLKHADTAMYAAKQQGPNRFSFYDASMSDAVSRQLSLRDDLRLALDQQQFEVFYQPIIDAATGRVRAAEALLRWNHPEHGQLSPAGFIDVAEQSGLINPIGDWVLHEALGVAAAWQANSSDAITMHVNVSAHQLKQAGFVDGVRSMLKAADLPARLLDLEMTESALLDDARRAEQLLIELKSLGVRIALDDFGTGFSSLAYLKRLPVDTIKIDKSFLDDIPYGPRDCALVESILTLGRELGSAIVAEGIEQAHQRDWLVARGCRYLQGFLFSRPVPRDVFLSVCQQTFVAGPSHSPTAMR